MKYVVVERYTDNGELSHHEIVNVDTGDVVLEDVFERQQFTAHRIDRIAELEKQLGDKEKECGMLNEKVFKSEQALSPVYEQRDIMADRIAELEANSVPFEVVKKKCGHNTINPDVCYQHGIPWGKCDTKQNCPLIPEEGE
jgi:uncharacterized coiled-coil protein SlyX